MIILAILLTIICGVIWYINYRLTYWQRKGIPTPGLSYQWNYYHRELGPYDLELTNKLGSVYGTYEALKPILIVSEPDLLRDILVKVINPCTSFPNHKPIRLGSPTIDLNMFSLNGDEQWKRIRSLLSPTFSTGQLRNMENAVNDCIKVFKKNLTKVVDKNETIDITKYSNAFTLDIICRCVYGTQIESLSDLNNPIQNNLAKVLTNRWELVFTILFPKIAKFTGIQNLALKPLNFFVQMTKTLIEERKKAIADGGINNGKVFNDILQTMLDANEEQVKKDMSGTEGKVGNNKTITEEEMVAQSFLFLVVGLDTFASILACTAYHLAKHPNVQDKLAAEVLELKEITRESVTDLKYLDAVLKESFRLSPPTIRIERECIKPILVGNIKIDPGTIVSIPTYVVHRDPKQYSNPEEFDPERFLSNNNNDGNKYHPYSYLPFGGGPRICIAQRFALLKVKLTLAQILKDFKFVQVPETKLNYYPASLDALAPKPIMLKIENRS